MKFFKSSVSIVLVTMIFVIAAASATADGGGVSIMPWYPQGSNYVFVCNAGFPATSYDFSFGDGQKLFDLTTNNVYHTFTQNGVYEVSCGASDQNYSEVYLLRVSVGTEQTVAPIDNQSATLEIAPYFPQGPNGLDYVFDCNAQGFTPTSYDWNFGDGQKLYDMPVNNVFHRFDQGGPYTVNCAASNSEYRVGASQIIAGGIPETPFPPGNGTPTPPTNTTPPVTPNATVVLSVAPYFPQAGNYVFICAAAGITPTSYDWQFGDGSQLLGMSANNVWHSYAPGNYTVSCTATDGVTSVQGTLPVDQANLTD